MALELRTLHVLFGITLGCYAPGSIADADIELPVDNEMKASIVAAIEYFHPQECVSSDFKTTLEEFETYWAVTLTDNGREVPIACPLTTVYVCKSNASLVHGDPLTACAT